MEKIYTVTDLGPGDGGKGGVVHKISHMLKALTILKAGAAQGSHGVSTSRGERFAFSQFGRGTFEGVPTHITRLFVASPEGILNEAAALRYEHGIHNVFDLLTVDEDVVCATPYHGISSRVKELARGENPRGTIGTGMGEAYRYHQRHGELTIRAKDLSKTDLRDRIAAVREKIRLDLAPLLSGDFLPIDQNLVEQEINRLDDPGFLDHVVQRFQDAARHVKVVGREYLKDHVFTKDGVGVVESSHGVLTDHFQGFHPHTSAIRTLPSFTHAMLREAGYEGKIVSLGITRAYQIRHGAGPMPTADPAMAENLLPGSHKEENRYQGKVRVGPLDLMLLRYAIAASGGPQAFDGLAITWFDQIQRNGSWWLNERYQEIDPTFCISPSDIRVRLGTDSEQLAYQEELGKHLNGCVPQLIEHKITPEMDRDKLYDLCADVLKEKLGVRVRMVSFGPTERDKVCR